jgi:hypothetical protein
LANLTVQQLEVLERVDLLARNATSCWLVRDVAAIPRFHKGPDGVRD